MRQTYGPIGILVNNAGIAHRSTTIMDADADIWQRILNNLTRCLAMELAQYQITVNAIGPGSVVTNLRENSGVPAGEARRDSQLNGDMEKFRIGIPLGRLGQPIDQANAIVFLASDEAEYISGQCLFVDGLHGQC